MTGHRRRVEGFHDPDSGEWRELVDVDGPASARQLRLLNLFGMLDLVAPGKAQPLSKAEAAGAIDDARAADARPRIHVPVRHDDADEATGRGTAA